MDTSGSKSNSRDARDTATAARLERLLAACRDGDVTTVRSLLQPARQQETSLAINPLLNAVGDTNTPLTAACSHNRVAVVAVLREFGADTSVRTKVGNYPLYVAA